MVYCVVKIGADSYAKDFIDVFDEDLHEFMAAYVDEGVVVTIMDEDALEDLRNKEFVQVVIQ